MDGDASFLREAQAARDLLREQQDEVERSRLGFHRAVRRLHSSGASMRDIAEVLGMSHQRVHQIVNGGDEMPTSTRPGKLLNRLVRRNPKGCGPGGKSSWSGEIVLDRFLVDAREAMSLAQEEARALGHDYLGTEHVLLGLLSAEHGLAARLLRAIGADLEWSRAAVRRILGEAPRGSATSLRPTERLKKVLDLARQEAKSLHSMHVRSEHLLLGLAREGAGLGAVILADLGVGYEQLRRRVDRAALACSFCGRSGLDVAHLTAGPGVFICDHCVEAAGRLEDPGSAAAQLRHVGSERSGAACSFCGKGRADVQRLVTARSEAMICGDCLALCREIQEEERGAFVPGRG